MDILIKRTGAINNGKWDQVTELNRKLTEQVHKDSEKCCTPIGAFVTFRDEYSYNQMEGHDSVEICGHQCAVEKAPEPTNIIWENVGYDTSRRAFRMFIIVISAFIIFSISFFAMKHTANRAAFYLDKYDHSIPCSTIKNFYTPEVISRNAADEFAY